MSVITRREEIANLLLAEGKIKVGELAKRLQVTTETIRKDLIELEAKGIIKKNKGCAEVLNEYYENNYFQKSEKNIEGKRNIAIRAAKLIPPGATIFLDAGSTTYQLARQLVLRKDITVITNFMPTAELLFVNNIKVILIGGEVRQVSGAAVGQFARLCICKINADMAFISTSGFKNSDGPCVENFSEADTKKDMIDHSAYNCLLTDGSKAHTSAMVKFAEWSDFDLVIMDDETSKDTKEKIEKSVEVILVSSDYGEEHKNENISS